MTLSKNELLKFITTLIILSFQMSVENKSQGKSQKLSNNEILLLLVKSGAKPGCLISRKLEEKAISLGLKTSKREMSKDKFDYSIFVYNEEVSDPEIVSLKLGLNRRDSEMKKVDYYYVTGKSMGYISPWKKGAVVTDRVVKWFVDNKLVFQEGIAPFVDEKVIQDKFNMMNSKMEKYPPTSEMKLKYSVVWK